MLEQATNLILAGTGIYFLAGAALALALHARGLKRIDSSVAGAGLFFRALVTPGLIALWPVLIRKWAAAASAPEAPPYNLPVSSRRLRAIHLLAIAVVGTLAPLLAGFALFSRPPEILAVASDAREFELRAARGEVRIREIAGAGERGSKPLALMLMRPGCGDSDIGGATLLGLVRPGDSRRFMLPAAARGGSARIVLYSLETNAPLAAATLRL